MNNLSRTLLIYPILFFKIYMPVFLPFLPAKLSLVAWFGQRGWLTLNGWSFHYFLLDSVHFHLFRHQIVGRKLMLDRTILRHPRLQLTVVRKILGILWLISIWDGVTPLYFFLSPLMCKGTSISQFALTYANPLAYPSRKICRRQSWSWSSLSLGWRPHSCGQWPVDSKNDE